MPSIHLRYVYNVKISLISTYSRSLSLFDTFDEDDKPAVTIEAEVVSVKSYARTRKPKATYDEIFENIKTTQVAVDPLSEEERAGQMLTMLKESKTEEEFLSKMNSL